MVLKTNRSKCTRGIPLWYETNPPPPTPTPNERDRWFSVKNKQEKEILSQNAWFLAQIVAILRDYNLWKKITGKTA
jgi:hypothetical protein